MTAPWEFSDFDDHESVHVFRDAAAGLTAIVAIHSTRLGPAGGGTRFWHYADGDAAMTDALRLSKGMSYKNALAGLKMGGGKGVIIADEAHTKTPAMITAYARAIDSLAGHYVTAQDVGMIAADMIAIGSVTRHVCGLPAAAEMAGGDPGPSTALGVFLGIKAAVRRKLGRDTVDGVHVAIQGVGSVGGGVARHLAGEGARLTLADRDAEKAAALASELGSELVAAEDILAVPADVFSPCALGAILNETSIGTLRVPIVAGGANNQLARPEDGARLVARDILYAPDYAINAGGIINVGLQYLEHASVAQVHQMIENIPVRLEAIWSEADASGSTPAEIADKMAARLIGRS